MNRPDGFAADSIQVRQAASSANARHGPTPNASPAQHIEAASREQLGRADLVELRVPTALVIEHLDVVEQLIHRLARWYATSGSDDAAKLAGPGGFHKIERGLKQLEVLLVLSRFGAVDLYPFPRASHTAGLKRDDVAP